MNFTPNFAGIINALKYIIENGVASGGGGGSSGGITQSQVQAAIQGASNLDELETEVKKFTALINSNKLPVEIGNTGTVAISNFPIIQIVSGITTDLVTASYIRPADTTGYTNNDALSNSTSAPTALTFNNASRINGGSGYLTNCWCATNQPSFSGAIRLHLFRGNSAPSAINDNAVYQLLGDNVNRIGYVDFSGFQTGGTGSDTAICVGAFPQGRNIPFSTNTANSSIYGLVEVRSAFTPTSGQTFNFYLGVEQN